MEARTQLQALVFQLTPTRTRYDLIIIANGKTERLSSGLLDPFLAHLKTAQDQIAKGGYSIRLEPKAGTDVVWFTKGTVDRFIRYVSSPEVLERVNTLESEILQINEAIAIQGNNSLGLSSVEDHQRRRKRLSEGNKFAYEMKKDKTAVLSKSGSRRRLSMGSNMQVDCSRFQLVEVLETRKSVLLKEQGMAFARAVAAGFTVDHMADLILFSKSFGASRLLKACLRFTELWKEKHKTEEWLDIPGADTRFTKNDNATSTDASCQQYITPHNKDIRLTKDMQDPGIQYYHNPIYPQWASHSQPAPTVPQFFPMEGMPNYQNYPGGAHQNGLKINIRNIRTSASQISEKRASLSEGKRSSVTVKSSSKPQPASDTETEEDLDLHSDTPVEKRQSSRSVHKNSGASKTSCMYEHNRDFCGQPEENGNWQAFQNLLLRVQREGTVTDHIDTVSSEKEILSKKRLHGTIEDPVVSHERNGGDAQRSQFMDMEGGGIEYRRTGKDDSAVCSSTIGSMRNTSSSTFIAENEHNSKKKPLDAPIDESFIVPSRSGLQDEHVTYDKSVLDLTASFLTALKKTKANSNRNKIQGNYEPNALKMLPKRGLEEGYTSYDPSKELDMKIPAKKVDAINIETRKQKAVPKNSQERLKRSEMEMKSTVKSAKSSKFNPLAEAKARAEKLRAFKADLQKAKKEKEEEERKRLETLKMERQKRIAARSSSNIAQSSSNAQQTGTRKPTRPSPSSCNSSKIRTPSPLPRLPTSISTQSSSSPQQTKLQKPTRSSPSPSKLNGTIPLSPSLQRLRASKISRSAPNSPQTTAQKPIFLSPGSHKSSKFRDTSPLLSSPLQRLRATAIKASKFTDTEPSSSSSLQKLPTKTTVAYPSNKLNGTTPLSKRMSDPSSNSIHQASLLRAFGINQVSKTISRSEAQAKKTSANVSADKIRSLSLPENKIRTLRGPSVESQKNVSVRKLWTSGKSQAEKSNRVG